MTNPKYAVGDEIYADFGQYSRIDVASGKVTKVTPSGQFTVTFNNNKTERFMPDGCAIGYSDRWGSAPKLIDRDIFEDRVVEMRQQAIRSQLRDMCNNALTGSRDEILARIDQMRAIAEQLT
jgi:hypothetical protein